MKSKRAREAAEADDKPINGATSAEAPAKKRKRDQDDGAAAGVTKKSKKDKKDKKKDKKESRKEKKEKRKDLQNLPEEDEAPEEQDEAVTAAAPESKAKDKTVNGVDEDKEAKKREKRERKKEKKEKKENQAKNAAPSSDAKKGETNGDDAPANADAAIDLDETTATKADRHIVFVGNLPFSATATSISAHFASLSPIGVRCLKNKNDDNPCRGIAFVEFGKVWHMRTCLDKFHHSMFDDGISPPRRINVELTAGGGGKTKQRQEKIREKNRKLDENRSKRIEKEKNVKVEKKQEQHSNPMEGSMHPSRMARTPGLAH